MLNWYKYIPFAFTSHHYGSAILKGQFYPRLLLGTTSQFIIQFLLICIMDNALVFIPCRTLASFLESSERGNHISKHTSSVLNRVVILINLLFKSILFFKYHFSRYTLKCNIHLLSVYYYRA
jgi:hypothetical protein